MPDHRAAGNDVTGAPRLSQTLGGEPRPRASELLDGFLATHQGERITLGDLVDILGDRAFGALLFILALPVVIPVPGLSTVLGVPMVLIGVQMIAGRHRLWLPRRVAAASFRRDLFERVVTRARPHLLRVERLLRERLPVLTEPLAERLLGAFIVIQAGVMALPIVFGNQPPALAIALIALGLIERDGAFVLAGLVAGVIAVAIAAGVVLGFAGGLVLLVQNLFA